MEVRGQLYTLTGLSLGKELSVPIKWGLRWAPDERGGILFARHSTKLTSHSSEVVSCAIRLQSLPRFPQTLTTRWLGYIYGLLFRYNSAMQGFRMAFRKISVTRLEFVIKSPVFSVGWRVVVSILLFRRMSVFKRQGYHICWSKNKGILK